MANACYFSATLLACAACAPLRLQRRKRSLLNAAKRV